MRKYYTVLAGENGAAIALFFLSAFVARKLGPEGVGIYSVAVALFTVAAQASSMGVPTAYMISAKKNDRVNHFPKEEFYVCIFLGLFCALLLTGLVNVLSLSTIPIFAISLLSILYLPLSNIRALFRNHANVNERYNVLARIPFYGALAQVSVVLLASVFLELNPEIVLFAFVIAVLGRVLSSIPTEPFGDNVPIDMSTPNRVVFPGLKYLGYDLAFLMYGRIAIFVLAYNASTLEAGLFAKAAQLAMILNVVTQGIMPLILNEWISKSNVKMMSELNTSLGFLAALAIVSCLIVAQFAEELLIFVFGLEFSEASGALVINFFAAFVLLGTRIVHQARIVVGEVNEGTLILAAMSILQLIIYLIFVQQELIRPLEAISLAILITNSILFSLSYARVWKCARK